MSKILHSLNNLNALLKKEKSSEVFIVTSLILAKRLSWAIKEINIPQRNIFFLPNSEAAKDWNEIQKLLKKFSEKGLDRNAIVVALGGGSVGDATGFACSIYLRGIRYIQLPTTLLAQVDSAHGGKTGINFLSYKNQIGSFYQPIAIIIDTRFLKSLSNDQIIDGLGEIIKAGLIKDATILDLLKKQTVPSLLTGRSLQDIIRKSIEVKKYYINKDPNDHGLRQILNFGHTIGHALELKYKISHGKSVIMGMLAELSIGESLKITPIAIKKDLMKLLSSMGIDVEFALKPDWKTILHDKKINANSIALPIIEKEGRAKLLRLSLDKIKLQI